MKRIVLIALACSILVFFIAACAGIGQPPAEVVRIHREVKSRIVYTPYAAYDYSYVPRGTRVEGNCAKFAYTAWRELEASGLPAVMVSCTTKQGVRHVYARSGIWALDVRFKEPVNIHTNQLECI